METKYNIERQFIEGYDVVDPIDQATFCNQIVLDFSGPENNQAIMDLSMSNFFIADCELASSSIIDFDIINFGNTQRFELLIQASYFTKTLRFFHNNPNVQVSFPFKYRDDEENVYDFAPMEPMLREQMLITFRLTTLSDGQIILVGIPTPWFASNTTHSQVCFRVLDSLNVRFPSNVEVEIWNSKDSSKKLVDELTGFGLSIGFIPKIPAYYSDSDTRYHYRLKLPHLSPTTYKTITGSFSKEEINGGMMNIPINIQEDFPDASDFIPLWEVLRGPDYSLVSKPYREGDIVRHNPGGEVSDHDGTTYRIFRRNTTFLEIVHHPLVTDEPGFFPEGIVFDDTKIFEIASIIQGAFSWDRWFPSGYFGGAQGWYRFMGGPTPIYEDPDPSWLKTAKRILRWLWNNWTGRNPIDNPDGYIIGQPDRFQFYFQQLPVVPPYDWSPPPAWEPGDFLESWHYIQDQPDPPPGYS